MTTVRPLPSDVELRVALTAEPRFGLADAMVAEAVGRAATVRQRRRSLPLWPWPAPEPRVLDRPRWVQVALAVAVALSLAAAGLLVAGQLTRHPLRNGLLAVARGWQIELVDATGRSTGTSVGTYAFDPTWSPDGSRVAFWNQDGNRYWVEVLDPVTGQLTTFPSVSPQAMPLDVSTGVFGRSIQWSPDGGRLLMEVEAGVPVLYEANLADASIHPLTRTGEQGFAAWSPDGSRLAYWAAVPFMHDWSLYLAQPDGSQPRKLIDRIGGFQLAEPSAFPIWTPDSRSVLLVVREAETDGPTAVVRVDVASGAESDVAEWPVAAVVQLSPDGASLAAVVPSASWPNRLVVLDLDGSALHEVARDVCGGFGWSPDAARLFYSTPIVGGCVDKDQETILLAQTVAADGSDVRTLWREEPGARPRSGFANIDWQRSIVDWQGVR